MATKVLIVDDHEVFRLGLRRLLKRDKDLELVGEAGTGNEVLSLVEKLKPHVVLMDVRLPDMEGIAATYRIKARLPKIHVIALTFHDELDKVERMFEAGASGYVLKSSVAAEILDAIRVVARGELFMSPRVKCLLADNYVKWLRNRASNTERVYVTENEHTVLRLLEKRCTLKEIARQMSRSVSTVKTFVRRAKKRLNAQDTSELLRQAVSRGLIAESSRPLGESAT